MTTSSLSTLSNATDIGREHVQRAIEEMPNFSKEFLLAAGTGATRELQTVLREAHQKVHTLMTSLRIPQESVVRHVQEIQDAYTTLKKETRHTLIITKSDPRWQLTRTIANVCATLHAQLLALAEAMKAQGNAASEEAKALPAPSGHGNTGFQLGPKPPDDDLAFPFDDLTEDLPEGPTSSR